MAIATVRDESTAVTFLFTAADVAVLPKSLPSGDVDYEINNGKLVVMPPPGDLHSAFQSNLATELKIQGERNGHGKCRPEVGILLWRSPDRLVGADVAFITNKSLPLRRSREGYLLTIPELVVEIRSKNDSDLSIQEKVRDYLKAGVHVVWIVEPERRVVLEYRADESSKTFAENDTLVVDDVIPGFRMPVAEVFQD